MSDPGMIKWWFSLAYPATALHPKNKSFHVCNLVMKVLNRPAHAAKRQHLSIITLDCH